MSERQPALIGHYCPKCFIVVAYSTPLGNVDCPGCKVRAVPNSALKEPKPGSMALWDGRL
jgi:hypothetical protein